MEGRLASREKMILKLYLSKGELKITDIMLYYKTKRSIDETINRFILLGILKRGEGDKFLINKEKVLEALHEK
jgi:hypothetical protein